MGRFALEETEIITFAHNEGKEKLKINFFFTLSKSVYISEEEKKAESEKQRK